MLINSELKTQQLPSSSDFVELKTYRCIFLLHFMQIPVNVTQRAFKKEVDKQ